MEGGAGASLQFSNNFTKDLMAINELCALFGELVGINADILMLQCDNNFRVESCKYFKPL